MEWVTRYSCSRLDEGARKIGIVKYSHQGRHLSINRQLTASFGVIKHVKSYFLVKTDF